MDAIYIPNEKDIKKWIKEGISEALQTESTNLPNVSQEEPLLNRQEIAALLRISLVTLTTWVKHGLPSHRYRGRVYFDKMEVIAFIKEEKLDKIAFTSRLHHLKELNNKFTSNK